MNKGREIVLYPELLRFMSRPVWLQQEIPTGCGHLGLAEGPRQCTWAVRVVSKTDMRDSAHEEASGGRRAFACMEI